MRIVGGGWNHFQPGKEFYFIILFFIILFYLIDHL